MGIDKGILGHCSCPISSPVSLFGEATLSLDHGTGLIYTVWPQTLLS